MKSEELLSSLDYVGEDLLAGAEQTVLVRKRRPWLGAAVAAVLVLAVGVGGFLLLKKHLPGKQAPQPGDPSSVLLPVPDGELPMLCVYGNAIDQNARNFDDPERSLAVNRWTLETGAERLPVYELSCTFPDLLGWSPWSEAELQDMVRDAAVRLGAAEPVEIQPLLEAELGYVTGYEARTELGTVSVDLKGRILVLFNEDHRLTDSVKIDFAEELPEEEIRREYQNAIMQSCGEQVEALLGLPKCRPAVCDSWDSLSSSYQSYLLYPIREDPAEQLKSRWYEAVRLLTVDGRSVVGLSWDRLPEAGETSQVPLFFERLGDYPIISLEQARELALSGNYLCARELSGTLTENKLCFAELVYLPEGSRSLLLPFYRFWVCEKPWESVACLLLTPVLVPAVDPSYLEDFPAVSPTPPDTTAAYVDPDVTETTEPVPADTGETEPADTDGPAPTEPPDGYQPLPATGSDGTPEIAGPAGNVPALQYMGGGCQDPVWADVDGDGEKELVYRGSGPTSGLFTELICVYGLHQGWPVLEAAQIFHMVWGELSLTADDGQVQLHYTPRRWDPEQQTDVAQAEQVLSVTVKDGALLLNGGALPEEIELWGGTEWAWYGSSFAALKGKAMEAGAMSDMPRLRIYDDYCLVWTQPNYSASIAAQRVFAAVTENGVTVTGLLRWEPAADGTYHCVMQGIEAIDTPSDLTALEGLSMTQLTERYGPCHIDMGSGLYIPCWFTKDAKLLVVHIFDTVRSAELQDLSQPEG